MVRKYLSHRWVHALLLSAVLGASSASAQIIQLANNQNNCAANGNPACFDYATDTPYSLTDILNGSEVLTILNNSTTPSWFIQNDTGATVHSISLIFDGHLASNANLQCNFGGGESGSCYVDGIKNGLSNPIPAGDLPATIQFTGLSIGAGTDFEIVSASFAHSGQDYGCIAGVAIAPGNTNGVTTCTPTSMPEPGVLTLLLPGLMVAGVSIGLSRRWGGARQRV
jgi:hypothetical protein